MTHTPGSSSQGQSGLKAIKTQTKTKFEVKKREVKTGVGGASGPVSAGSSPTPVTPAPVPFITSPFPSILKADRF